MNLLAFLLLFSTLAAAQSNQDRLERIQELQRFAFGSCNKLEKEQTLWVDMILQRPQLFIWGGDNVYIDSKDPEDIRAAYEKQNAIDEYRIFKSLTPIIGTWDDHDYGQNNGNGSYAAKAKSQQYALDFLEEPAESPRRFQEGIYTSYEFGPAGRKVKFILLDNRYFKDLEPDALFLGNRQWKWLETQLRNSGASLHFIVSGLSVLSPTIPWSEEWADYPEEFARLKELIWRINPKGLVFLTGDKHFSSIFERHGLLEFMSSGMTHSVRVPLRPYVRAHFPTPLFENNYGIVDIEWTENGDPVITMHNRTDWGAVRNHKRFRWSPEGWKRLSLQR